MDTPLSPRDIQTRIRAGESLEDVVAGSGMDAERIERFAAPVLAEREHLALTALGSSVRRRGEASGHRPLRSVVAERLRAQGVDGDDVRWDAWKTGDSQWQLSADYELQGEPRHAEFRFDAQGRFSVAEDDEARWLAGEAPSPVAAKDDRDDELALVRATREPSHDDGSDGDDDADEPGATPAETQEMVRAIAEELGAVLQVVPPPELSAEELAALLAEDPESDSAGEEPRPVRGHGRAHPRRPSRRGGRADHRGRPAPHPAHRRGRLGRHGRGRSDRRRRPRRGATAAEDEARSALDTLYDMLGGVRRGVARASTPACPTPRRSRWSTSTSSSRRPTSSCRRSPDRTRPSPNRRPDDLRRGRRPARARGAGRRTAGRVTRPCDGRRDVVARPPSPAPRRRARRTADPEPGRLAQARAPQAGVGAELGRDHVRRTEARLTGLPTGPASPRRVPRPSPPDVRVADPVAPRAGVDPAALDPGRLEREQRLRGGDPGTAVEHRRRPPPRTPPRPLPPAGTGVLVEQLRGRSVDRAGDVAGDGVDRLDLAAVALGRAHVDQRAASGSARIWPRPPGRAARAARRTRRASPPGRPGLDRVARPRSSAAYPPSRTRTSACPASVSSHQSRAA